MNEEWFNLLKNVYYNGQLHKPRGLCIKEILNGHFEVDMNYPILSINERKIGYKFMFREAWWIMDGRNTVDTITNFSKTISSFSNDGFHFDGAYGPRVIDQIRYIVDTLEKDRESRQAVLTIWRPNPRESLDVPCTVSIQWFIRDNVIYCIDTMRSSDIWLGVPYDTFNFTMLTGYVMLLLRKRGIDNLKLGKLYINAGSQHLYENNFNKVEQLLLHKYTEFDYQKFDPYQFNSPIELKEHLKYLSEREKNENIKIW